MKIKLIEYDPYLEPHKEDLSARIRSYKSKKKELCGGGSLSTFAEGYKYFGFHKTRKGWVYREWAPGADNMYVTGDFCHWNTTAHKMTPLGGGVFEIYLPECARDGQNIQAIVEKDGELLRRVPSYATYVVQDSDTTLWCAKLKDTLTPYKFTDSSFKMPKNPIIYECHIGMAQEKYGVGTYKEFTENVLPRIADLGYNTIQIMAIAEHPYYGSFGYQVSNFFAPSSRFGTPEDLKELINTAHNMGIAVLLDLVHSHAVKNVGEGLNLFDGTDYQYFHKGAKGEHPAWDTKLFDYGKNQVLHFLLSNIKYWMEQYHFDGFRFDGVTSMLYHDHALSSAFVNYDMYFSMNTDTDAVTYLCLANDLIHSINKNAVSIAEDMSGMPGMCLPQSAGGIGFDYRLSMGMPDLWIKYLKEYSDEDWDMGKLWWELNTRRVKEKTIGYCESHDQALVGDKTIMFRLCDKNMYYSMSRDSKDMIIDRGMALHKMIRLITASLGGDGYLNFMGNEFGHPEWIDFPREGNGWSYHYCRRQWSLVDNQYLLYKNLNDFDKAMIKHIKKEGILKKGASLLCLHQDDKVLAFSKGDNIYVFNFHPHKSFEGYFIETPKGLYKTVLSTDDKAFGGQNRVSHDYVYTSEKIDSREGIKLYIPARCAFILKKQK